MTTDAIVNTIKNLDLHSMTDEELSKVRAALSLKTSEADWIINGRKHFKKHSSSNGSN